ncbi:Ribosomal 50S subunit-recycling heat shock protein, contains S4 domain, partial [Dysosmobacter welbionis]
MAPAVSGVSAPVISAVSAGSMICPSSPIRICPSPPRSGSSGRSSRLVRWKARRNCLVVRYRRGLPGTCRRPHSSMSFRSSSR